MKKQTFQELSDLEFEDLVNDLLELELQCKIERFKPGKDAGIDGRYSIAGKTTIIQSKHYLKSGVSGLIAAIVNDENEKARKLNPTRYIFATSVSLSPPDKDKIIAAFNKIKLETGDILGCEEINAMLSRHGEIYKKCYKLWAQSSDVLELFLHPEIYSKEITLINKIEENRLVYVETSDVDIALDKLKNENVVIITGEPGVGKTSLAEHLCHIQMNLGYSVHVINSNITSSPINLADKEKRMIYYYDDFIGSNYLDAITNKHGSFIVDFIAQIRREPNKKLILTSRSSIVNLAQFSTQAFRNYRLIEKQYVIDVKNMSELVRGKILYSHLWHSKISMERKVEVASDGFYWRVIRHKNFNPRLIAFSVDVDRLGKGSACESLYKNLENPAEIWDHCFMTQNDEQARIFTKLCTANGGTISEQKLESAYYSALRDYNFSPPSNISWDFHSTAKILTGSLVNRNISQNLVEYTHFNPSISDYVINKILNEYDAKILINNLDNIEVVRFYSALITQGNRMTPATKTNIVKHLLSRYINECDERFYRSFVLALDYLEPTEVKPAIIRFKDIASELKWKFPGVSSALILEICKRIASDLVDTGDLSKLIDAEIFDENEYADLYRSIAAIKIQSEFGDTIKVKIFDLLHYIIEDYVTNDDEFRNCTDESDLQQLIGNVRQNLEDGFPMLNPDEIEAIISNIDDSKLLEKIEEMNNVDDNSSYYPRGNNDSGTHWSVEREIDRMFGGFKSN